jgi:NAD(P)-dependent dehydrogenase (short-subunit alcohol dehydrogenase family)
MDYDRNYFNGKTAAVTGAASGVGLALVEELLQSKAARVVMADINPDRLAEHEKRLEEQHGDRVKGILCDVTAEENVQKMIAEATEFFGGQFDLLFNNAGAGFSGWFSDMTNEDWKNAFDLNFWSALYGMRAVLPIMVKQGGGQIINVISGIAFVPMPCQTRYTATKTALNGLSLALRTEYWDDNIKISSATPGTTATAIWGDPKWTPEVAQTPQQSASRILNGAVNNDRVIFGDDVDAKYGYNPLAEELDQGLIEIARERRKGNVNFLPFHVEAKGGDRHV